MLTIGIYEGEGVLIASPNEFLVKYRFKVRGTTRPSGKVLIAEGTMDGDFRTSEIYDWMKRNDLRLRMEDGREVRVSTRGTALPIEIDVSPIF